MMIVFILIVCLILIVEIWFDLICLWCWIGKCCFDEVLVVFVYVDCVDVVLCVYWLMFGQFVELVEVMLVGKYWMLFVQVDQMLCQVIEVVVSVGLCYDLFGMFVGDMFDGYWFVKFVEVMGCVYVLIEWLYCVYFCEYGLLFDYVVLIEFVVEVGFECLVVEVVLYSDVYCDEVEVDIVCVVQIGGCGVLLFVFGGCYVVFGVQLVDVFVQVFDWVWCDGIVEFGGSDVVVCGFDGCELFWL